jgi:carbamoyltransferase
VRVLGINAVFHDPAAALVADGETVAAAEEERFTRRKHGKPPVPFATWELPARSASWCVEQAGLRPEELDAVASSYDPGLAPPPGADLAADGWEGLRTLYAQRAPQFLRAALPGLDPACVRFVPHHLAHAASAYLAAPYPNSSVLVLDGRGEHASHLAGRARGSRLEVLAAQRLPHSLGLLYEEVTEHLGFQRSSDEYKVMALAVYGEPSFLRELREAIRPTGDGGFTLAPIELGTLARRWRGDEDWSAEHADLAASLQTRLEEVLLELARWLHRRTGDQVLTMAGGVALNCVANSRIAEEGPFEQLWVQPAADDAGTALGAAMYVARALGDHVRPTPGADLGRGWSDPELEGWLASARLAYQRPGDLVEAVGEAIAEDGVVAWFQGRSEYGPRALGHRSLLANATRAANTERLNEVKGREQFRPVAPMVLAERRTGVPVVINTSLNTAGRPMVDDPRDALECFGSARRSTCWPSARSWCAGRGWRDREPPPVRRGGPDAGPAVARQAAGGTGRDRLAGGRGRAGGGAAARAPAADRRPPWRRRRAGGSRAGAAGRAGDCGARPWGWAGGGPQPQLAAGGRAVGGVPRRRRAARPRLARGPGGRPGRPWSRGRREPGPAARAAAGGAAADRLGAQPGRAGGCALGHGRPCLPALGACRGRRLRRALPARLPRGQRPGPAGGRGRLPDRARPAHGRPPDPPGRAAGERPASGRQRRRRAHVGAARPRLARDGGRARRPPTAAPGHHPGRAGRGRLLGAAPPPAGRRRRSRLARRHYRAHLGPDRPPGRGTPARSPRWR